MSIVKNAASAPGSPPNQAGGRSDVPGASSPGPGIGSVQSAERAPSRRWLAHVWPAIALGPVGRLLAGPRVGAVAALLTRPAVLGLVSGLAAGTAGIEAASPSQRTAIADSSQPDSQSIALPADGAISILILIAASAVLMALLTYAVKTELGPFSYWPR